MSTLATNAITDASGGNTATINSYTPTESNMAGRNRIINGGFNVWQRGTSFNVNASGTSATYIADRWCLFPANTGFTAVAQAVQISGGGLRINCATSASYATTADVLSLQQRIEGHNCVDLSGKQVTISFKVKTNKTGNYGVTLYAADTSTWGTPQSITVNTADVETTYTLTFTAQSGIVAANTEGLRLVLCLAANTARAGVYYPTGGSQVNLLDNTSNYFELYEVQLEVGSVTPFERRQYGQELALCQRYYWQRSLFNYNSNTAIWEGYYGGGTGVLNIDLPVTMRASPTLTVIAPTQVQVYESGGWTNRTISAQYSTPDLAMFNVSSTTHAYGKLLTLSGGSTAPTGQLSAEL